MIFRDIDFFNDGILLNAGRYVIRYQCGSFATSPSDIRHHVYGYNVVTKAGPDAPSVLLCAAPCTTDPDGGYASEQEARSANEGMSGLFKLETPAAVFLKRGTGVEAYPHADGEVPTWEIDAAPLQD